MPLRITTGSPGTGVAATSSTPTAQRRGIGLSADDNVWSLSALQAAAEMALIASTGTDSIRMNMKWDVVEPTTKGVYDWTIPDRLYDAADAQGLTVLFIFVNSPSWARTAGEPSYIYAPTNVQDLADFAAACVARYKARGRAGCHLWEVYNEPNNAQYFMPNTGYAKFVALLGAAYTAIKAADSTATVIAGGVTSGQDSRENYTTALNFDYHFIREAYAAGMAGKFDVLGYHPYAKGWDPLLTAPTGLGSGSELITNLLTANATNWFGDNATVTWVASPARTTGALQFAITGATTPGAHFGSSIIAVTPGQLCLAQAYLRSAAAGHTMRANIQWYDSGHSLLSQSNGETITTTTTGWTLATCRATAPASAAFATIKVTDTDAGANGTTHYLADPSFQLTSDTGHGWNRIAAIRALMVANGDSAKPIWITEVGQASSSATFGVTEAVQATYLGRALQRLHQFPYVERMFWFTQKDSGTDTTVLAQNYGLYHNDGVTAKAALAVLRDGIDAGQFAATAATAGAIGAVKILGTPTNPAAPVVRVREGADAAYAPQNPKLIVPVSMPNFLPTSAQAATANRLYFARSIVPQDGTLAALAYLVTTQSGNVIASVYDTGDALAGSRTRLWTSGSTAVGAAGWQSFAPALAGLLAGQQIEFAVIFDNATVNFGRIAQPVAGNAQSLPAGFFPAAGGASPKITGTFDVGSFTAPATVTEAQVAATSSVAPVVIGRLS